MAFPISNGMDKNKIYRTILRDKYSGKYNSAVKVDTERVLSGEPLDYVIGHCNFLGANIGLSERPLIPREETEYWVEKAIHAIDSEKGGDEKFYFLDLFSGSGCIGIALMSHFQNAYVDFVDSEGTCIRQIRKNIVLNSLPEDRTRVYLHDVFPPSRGKYDYIFANPPYIDENTIDTVEKSVVEWEPHGALFAKERGLYYIKKVIEGAPKFLNPGATLFIEIGCEQKDKILSYAKDVGHFDRVDFWKDQFDRDRVVVLSPHTFHGDALRAFRF